MASATEKYNWCVENSIVAASDGVGVVRVKRDRALPGGEIHLGLTVNERRDATGETTRCDGCDDAMTDDGF